jgi:hypothetical protein
MVSRLIRVWICALGLLVAAGGPALAQCTDCDSDGHAWPADCNDADAGAFPGATEACDGFDNDCNAVIDDDIFCDGQCLSLAKNEFDTLVSGDPADSQEPTVAWTGDDFGIAWRDDRHTSTEIYFALVSAVGVKITADLRVTEDPAASVSPKIVWTGTEFGLAWMDERDGNREIYFTRLDTVGVQIGADLRITNDVSVSEQPSLVWTGAEYGLTWTDDRDQDMDANREVYFARLDRTGAKIGSDVRVTSDTAVSVQSSLAWSGSEYGVAWTDERDGNREIYFARISATGVKIGTDLRVTSDAAISAQPSLVWSGSEYGLAWTDERNGNREIYFARMSSAGSKLGSDTRITNDLEVSEQASLDWTGEEYGVAWRDRRVFNGEIYLARIDAAGTKQGTDLRVNQDLGLISRDPEMAWTGAQHAIVWQDIEVNLARVDCDCLDEDEDGVSSCNDCDDSDDSVYPTAPQICDGLNNDCNDASWPALTDTNEADDDGDTLSECAGDCDDNAPGCTTECIDNDGDLVFVCANDCDDGASSVYPLAPQICDGLNNDCDDLAWPALTGTNEFDNDGDSHTECQGDCAPSDGDNWATPGEAQNLQLTYDGDTGVSTLTWQAPAAPGGTSVLYDAVRSLDPQDFDTGASCVAGDEPDPTTTDTVSLPANTAAYYLVRAENSCPVGLGSAGPGPDGEPRGMRDCD